MSPLLKAVLIALATFGGISAGYIFFDPTGTLTKDDWIFEGGKPTNWKDGGLYHAAPGPVAGAGLPFLAVGYGVYWLVKRRRTKV